MQFGQNGYYFITAFNLSLRERMEAIGARLYREGLIPTKKIEMKSIEEVEGQFGVFGKYLAASSSLVKADKLAALGWEAVDLEWLRLVQEAPGYRC